MSRLSWLKTPPAGGGWHGLLWGLTRAVPGLFAGWAMAYFIPEHWGVSVVILVSFIVILTVTTPPLQMINWRRRGCTICGVHPAHPAPTGQMKPRHWFYPHDRLVVEYVCVGHLHTWIKMRTVVDAE